MKLNIGCGFSKAEGFLNLDKYPACKPDQVMDAEVRPWPFDDNSVDEVLFNHSLEHMGADTEVFLGLLQELYRVCKPGAKVQINVPHPWHDNFINDPTHVRIITPVMFTLFSKRICNEWVAQGVPNTALALYLDVDFEVRGTNVFLEERHLSRLSSGEISYEQVSQLMRVENNVVLETHIELEVIKA